MQTEKTKYFGGSMTIYLDVVLIENLLLNYIILIATSLVRKTKLHLVKMLFASLFGSICSIINYILPLNGFFNFIFKIITSVLVVVIGFENHSVMTFFKNILSMYLITLTFGGASFMFMFFVSPEKIILKANHFVGTYPVKMAILGGFFALILITIISKFVKDRFKNLICDLEIGYKGKILKLKTFIDSRKFIKRANLWK
jgi:stage II sporulation protein GA (sporulation sigma-E factor processing peptidase)